MQITAFEKLMENLPVFFFLRIATLFFLCEFSFSLEGFFEYDTECQSVSQCDCDFQSDGIYYICRNVTENIHDEITVILKTESQVLIVDCNGNDNQLLSKPGLLARFEPIIKSQPHYEIKFTTCLLPVLKFGQLVSNINVTALNFEGFRKGKEEHLSADVFEGLKLKSLSLRYTGLAEIPSDVLKPVSETLRDLQICSYQNLAFPEDLFRPAVHLKRLNLASNKIKKLVKPIGPLPELENLYLHNNELVEIRSETFRGLDNLLTLDLQANSLETLPANAFTFIPKLQKINLFSNRLHVLPNRLFLKNSKLIEIDLHDNRLTDQLPDDLLFNLTRLRSVKLSRCNLTLVPKKMFQNLDSLTDIELQRNKITQLDEGMFNGSHSLKLLQLEYNQLSHLPKMLLRELFNLTVLLLNNNRIQNLPTDFLDGVRSLKIFHLHQNNLTFIPQAFQILSKLENLQLQHNKIEHIEHHSFVQLISLKHLDISSNSLQTAQFGLPDSVEHLNMSNNSIADMPLDWPSWLLNLSNLDLSHNRIKVVSGSNLQFSSAKAVINLEFNSIESIDLSDELSRIRPGKNQTSLVRLSHNPIHCDCRVHSVKRHMNKQSQGHDIWFRLDIRELVCASPTTEANKSVTSMQTEDLTCSTTINCLSACSCYRNAIYTRRTVDCQYANLTEIPAIAPPNVNILNMKGNLLTSLRGLEAPIWSTVTQLIVSENKLTSLNASFLPKNISRVYLDGNRLQNLTTGTLRTLTTFHIHEMKLGNNPWVCDCKDKALQGWLDASNPVTDSFNMICSNILNATVNGYQCPSASRNFQGLIAGLVVAAILLSILSVIGGIAYFKHLQDLRVWFYSRGWCLRLLSSDDIDNDKHFDAFVSFSQEDIEWVIKELVPELEEKEPNYHLCVHYRDWIVGEWIPDQIVRSVEASCRTIVVLSQNFLNSVWGRMEFKTAHHQALKDRMNRLIVVVVGDVPAKEEMDPEMRMYVDLNTYLRWGDPWFWKRLRYAMPHQRRTNTHKRNGNFWATPFPSVTNVPTTKL